MKAVSFQVTLNMEKHMFRVLHEDLKSTTLVIEDTGSMERRPEHVDLMGHGVEGNPLVKVSYHSNMYKLYL